MIGVVEYYKRTYRRWHLIWAVLMISMGAGTAYVLVRWTHPAKWLVLTAALAVVWFTPPPRWTLRSPPRKGGGDG
jgi:hypothetical protein